MAETLRVLTQASARAEFDVPVSILEHVIGAVDPVRLGRRGDPWLYFYEDFLQAYDPMRRRVYGVYYTPQAVVRCQTALVVELLSDAGATLPADGLHVYLTDTLATSHVDPPQPPLMAERQTEEQRRARKVKADVPIFVSIGNPPYCREQAEAGSNNTRGKWVRFGDSTSAHR